jgi:dephospho-CoA kinase
MSTRTFSVGLTGGIGCGKTTVADMFAARGAAVIDTDRIAHQLTAPGGLAIPAIRARFGDAFLTSSGAMDREKMRALVFADSVAKIDLESILHPLIRTETEHAATQARGAYLIFVVPLLIESGTWKQRISRLLVIDCPEPMQVIRVMNRNGLSKPQVQAIMATQVSRKERLDAADDVIVNDGDASALVPQIDCLHTLYTSLSALAAIRETK